MGDLGSAHLHRLYMATGTMLAKLSEFADQSGHEEFVALHRDKMRKTFEQVLGGCPARNTLRKRARWSSKLKYRTC